MIDDGGADEGQQKAERTNHWGGSGTARLIEESSGQPPTMNYSGGLITRRLADSPTRDGGFSAGGVAGAWNPRLGWAGWLLEKEEQSSYNSGDAG